MSLAVGSCALWPGLDRDLNFLAQSILSFFFARKCRELKLTQKMGALHSSMSTFFSLPESEKKLSVFKTVLHGESSDTGVVLESGRPRMSSDPPQI